MALGNNWVNYLQRSYKSIKTSIINRMSSIVPEITDYSESNIFIIIVGIFAGLIEQLNYYIDNLARELYLPTARRYSSLIKITRLIDYRVKAKIGATVDLKITAVDSSGDPVLLQNNETLNSGLIVKDSAGVEFITERKVTIFANTSSAVVGARQRVAVIDENIGTTSSTSSQIFELNDDYQDNTLQITINSISWELVDTFSFSGPNDNHFIVEVDQNKQAWLVFGDDINGAIPPNGQSIFATYYKCSGIGGILEANTITTWDSEPTPPVQTPVISGYNVTNELSSVGGLDEEGIEDIRKHAPLSLRTLYKAVTNNDHKDLCLLVPGVNKVDLEFNTEKKAIYFYIAPDGGGTASSLLLTDVEDYFSTRKILTSTVSAFAAGETKLRLTLTVVLKFRRNPNQAETDIKEALQESFGFSNSDVNKKIRRSDIIALIDNLDKVDYLSLDRITTKPYPRINNGSNQLESNWYIEVQTTSSSILKWRLAVTSSTIAYLYYIYNGQESFDSKVTINVSDPGTTDHTSSNGVIKIGMWGSFSIGDEWIFYTYPYNEDIVFEDNTIPIFDEAELILNIEEQLGL